jgi:hypothetical protein
MSATVRLRRIAQSRAAARGAFRPTPAERRAQQRLELWFTILCSVAFTGFAGLAVLRITGYVP